MPSVSEAISTFLWDGRSIDTNISKQRWDDLFFQNKYGYDTLMTMAMSHPVIVWSPRPKQETYCFIKGVNLAHGADWTTPWLTFVLTRSTLRSSPSPVEICTTVWNFSLLILWDWHFSSLHWQWRQAHLRLSRLSCWAHYAHKDGFCIPLLLSNTQPHLF